MTKQLSPQKEFRILQRKLDDVGFMTNIVRIVTGKKYEVVVNGSIERCYKRRASAKRYITKLYNNKVL